MPIVPVYYCLRAQHQPTEFDTHRFCVEASDLGFPVGMWPPTIETDLGNGLPFVWSHTRDFDTQVYTQTAGCIELHVFND